MWFVCVVVCRWSENECGLEQFKVEIVIAGVEPKEGIGPGRSDRYP